MKIDGYFSLACFSMNLSFSSSNITKIACYDVTRSEIERIKGGRLDEQKII